MKTAKSTLFADTASTLLRRALSDGFLLTIEVTPDEARASGIDLDGTVIDLRARSGQLALPLAPVEAAVPLERAVLVEAPAVDPLARGQRVMRAGDAVFEARSDGMLTWVVERVDGALVHLACDARTQTVARADIRLDSADLWCLASPFDRPDVGDCIELDGRAVEVLSTSRDGFAWREVEAAPPPAAKPKRTRKPRAPKAAPSTEPAAPVPHRLQAVTEADELAHHGAHSLIGLLRGEEWCTLATRAKDETAPEWQARITEAAKAVRVRVYDRGAHCTWDSADGNREGYIVGGAA